MNVTIISGSPRTPNLSFRAALFLKAQLENLFQQHTYSILDVREFPLPYVHSSWAKREDVPTEYSRLANLIFDADAYILVSPEYNGGYSPAMKNILDHFPKYLHKTFGIVTYSDGVRGGFRAALALQHLVCALFGIPCPHLLPIGLVHKTINEDGTTTDEALLKITEGFLKEFVWLAEAVAEKQK